MAESRLISWNLAGRVKTLPLQISAILTRRADILAFQEVTAKTALPIRGLLSTLGYPYIVDSFSLARDQTLLKGPRRYGQLIASRWVCEPLSPDSFDIPWPERVLSVNIECPFGPLELHTTGIPPGCSNGWTKIEMFEGIHRRLACFHSGHRILCGDFNTPKEERADGRIITWSDVGDRWDLGERNILTGLAPFDLTDVFRRLRGYGMQEFSWYWRGKYHRIGRRFDHVFASQSLNPIECHYLHQLRENGLSDHAPIEVTFLPP